MHTCPFAHQEYERLQQEYMALHAELGEKKRRIVAYEASKGTAR